MRKVRDRDTAPELIVRRIAHRLGYRFRLNKKDLPGKPDIVFPSRKKVIFVHGCFWHQHPGCKRGDRKPSSNKTYWHPKLERNKVRDRENRVKLIEQGWDSLVIWECEIKDIENIRNKIIYFLR